MKIVFVGETWAGSSARGVREAIARQPGVEIEEVAVDLHVPNPRPRLLRLANKVLAPLQFAELKRQIRAACADFEPDVIVFVKGWHVDAAFIRSLREDFAPVVNIFPDASPHAHGQRLKEAVGEYDLVIARNKYHPPLWKEVYGYDNRCVHVTHAYDPRAHICEEPVTEYEYDVVMVATGREEYAALLRELISLLSGRNLRIAVAGSGWANRGLDGEPGLTFVGVKPGRSYVEWLRKGKIVVAPVQTILFAEGVRQPGDEVSGRTFQCAAAYTFFIHKRTDEVKEYYDETTEVPMYNDAKELALKIEYYLNNDAERLAMATAAHVRAVPAYSFDTRAAEIVRWLETVIQPQSSDARGRAAAKRAGASA